MSTGYFVELRSKELGEVTVHIYGDKGLADAVREMVENAYEVVE